MPGLQCARCGRTEPARDDDRTFRTPQRMVVDDPDHQAQLRRILGHSWASINGEDVCPECQTPAERTDLAQRIVIAIEKEITRSDEAGLAPSQVEPALVPFAMQLREALQFDERVGSAVPDGGDPEYRRPERRHTHLEVAITGAFLTGCPLRIGIDEYDEVQHTLETRLGEFAESGWKSTADERREGTYRSGGGFSDVLPLVLVSRAGEPALARARKILDARPKFEHDWLDKLCDGWEVTPTAMRIDVYDLGVGVINGTFAVVVPAQTTLTTAATTVKKMVWLRPHGTDNVSSPITEMFRELSTETTREFFEGITTTMPERRQRPWLATAEPAQKPARDWGRLLWLHPVHMLASADPAKRLSSAAELAPTFSRSVSVPDGQFVPGIGWSAIVTDSDCSARDVPMKLLQLHWAYIALYMEIDRGLLTVLDRNEALTTRSLLSELEDAADEVFADYIRVMEARSRVDNALAGLGGDEQAIWDVISDVTKFDALVSGVDRKVEVLQRIAERRVQQATSVSDRRSARILGLLTSLALVTLATTLVAYFFGGFSDPLNDPHHYLRWVFLVVGAVLAVILWTVTFWWPRRRKRARAKARRTAQ